MTEQTEINETNGKVLIRNFSVCFVYFRLFRHLSSQFGGKMKSPYFFRSMVKRHRHVLLLSCIFAVMIFASAGVVIATLIQATPTLRVQYRVADPTSPGDNQIKAHLNIVNAGTTSVPLSELTIRYWYTNEGNRPQVYDCDYA